MRVATFECVQFDAHFISEDKQEIPLAVEHANQDFDWDSIDPLARNTRRLKGDALKMGTRLIGGAILEKERAKFDFQASKGL